MVPFWQEVSVVAAAVEVGTAPLAQVDTLVLWKRAGAQAASMSTPGGSLKAASAGCGPWQVSNGGVWCPGSAHGRGTTQGWRRSWAEHAWTGLVQS